MDLYVNFLNKKFENPFVLASSPSTADCDMISRAFDIGWAGAVIKTITKGFVENVQNRFAAQKQEKKIIGFENIELISEKRPEIWYKNIEILKKRFPEKIVIGSVMGDAKNKEEWIELIIGCQESGADLVELNFSCPHGYPEQGQGAAIGQNPKFASMIVEWIKEEKKINIPIVAKLTGAVSDIAYIGKEISQKKVDAFCAINTIPSIMGVDLKTLKPKPSVNGYTTFGGYSGIGIKPIALRAVSELSKSTKLPIMGSGGISSGFDAAEFILLGASIVQICTSVMLHGYGIINKMKKELEEFMSWHNFSKVEDFIGIVNNKITQYSNLDKNYKVKAKVNELKCEGCLLCFVSCRDAGNQAIEIKNKIANVDENKCTGCSLCYNVCPNGAITMI